MGTAKLRIHRAAHHSEAGADLLNPLDPGGMHADDPVDLVDDGDQLLRALLGRDVRRQDAEAVPERHRIGLDPRIVQPPGRTQREAGIMSSGLVLTLTPPQPASIPAQSRDLTIRTAGGYRHGR